MILEVPPSMLAFDPHDVFEHPYPGKIVEVWMRNGWMPRVIVNFVVDGSTFVECAMRTRCKTILVNTDDGASDNLSPEFAISET